jgi:hypothetical protein
MGYHCPCSLYSKAKMLRTPVLPGAGIWYSQRDHEAARQDRNRRPVVLSITFSPSEIHCDVKQVWFPLCLYYGSRESSAHSCA